MRKQFILILILLSVFINIAAFAFSPAGLIIENAASVSYESTTGMKFTTNSNVVKIKVAQICGIDISPNGTLVSPGRTYTVSPGDIVNITYTLKNTGNGADTYSLTVENMLADKEGLSDIAIYIDQNRNGQIEAGEPLYNNAAPPALNPLETLSLIVYGKVPGSYSSLTSILVNLKGTSACSAAKTDIDNVVQINVSAAGYITASKSVNKTTIIPGGELTYRIDFANPADSPAKGTSASIDKNNDGIAETYSGMLISDPLSSYLTFKSSSVQYSPSGTDVSPIYAGANGLWKIKPEQVSGKIVKVGLFIQEDSSKIAFKPKQSGYFQFSVKADSETYQPTIENSAYIQYKNSAGDSELKTITNKQLVNVITSVAGTITVQGPPTEIQLADGDMTADFVEEICNLENTTDTFNLIFDPKKSVNVGAGIEVKFYTLSGDPLPDNDGNGIPDTGSLKPGECFKFKTSVKVPSGTPSGQMDVVIKLESSVDPNQSSYTDAKINFQDSAVITVNKSADKTTLLPGEDVIFTINFSNDHSVPAKGKTVSIDRSNTGKPDALTGIIVYDTLPDQPRLVPSTVTYTPNNALVFPVYAGDNGIWKTGADKVQGKISKIGLFLTEDAGGIALDAKQSGKLQFTLHADAYTPPTVISNIGYVEYSNKKGEQKAESPPVKVEIPVNISVNADSNLPQHNDITEIIGSADLSDLSFPNQVCNYSNVDDTINLKFDPSLSKNVPPGTIVEFLDASKKPLPDTDKDGKPDTGVLKPGQCISFITHVIVPSGSKTTGDILFAIQGISGTDPTKSDPTYDKVIDDGFISAVKSADKTVIAGGNNVSFSIDFSNIRSKPIKGIPVQIVQKNGNTQTVTGVLVRDKIPDYTTLIPTSITFSPTSHNAAILYAGTDNVWKTDLNQVTGKIAYIGLIFKDDNGNAFGADETGYLRFAVRVDPLTPPPGITNTGYADYQNSTGPQTSQTQPVSVKINADIQIELTDGVTKDHSTIIDHAAPDSCVSFPNRAWNLGNTEDRINLFFDPSKSTNLPAGVTVEFYDMTGKRLTDTDGDGVPDTGPIAPGASFSFITKICIPPGIMTDNVTAAVKGTSHNNPSTSDYTYNKVGKIENVLVKISIKVKSAVQASVQSLVSTSVQNQVQSWAAKIALKNTAIIAYAYDEKGNLADQKKFITDNEGIISLDEKGNPFRFYNWMQPGLSYRISLADEYEGFTYYLTPAFSLTDFDQVKKPGDIFTRGETTVQILPDGTFLLITPLDPAGYVFDGATGEKIPGACVSLFRCNTQDCATYTMVDEKLLDKYPDGKTAQENGQVSGASDRNANNVLKSNGAFEFRFVDYKPEYDGWYFVGTDFSCTYLSAKPDLANKYQKVWLNKDQVWDPYSGNVYHGEKFYIDINYPGAILIRIPLMPSNYRNLEVTKTVAVSTVSVGDMIKFTITVKNPNKDYTVKDIRAYDKLPRELRYKPNTSYKDSAKIKDPTISPTGQDLAWDIGNLEPEKQVIITFYTTITAGATQGRKINTTFADGWSDLSHSYKVSSNTAQAFFQINKGEFTDKGIIIGKVFIDDNDNRIQDENEQGVKNVKIYMEDGRFVVTDSEGKYHIDNVDPGTHILKVDPLSLPPGSVLKTINNRNMDDPGSTFVDLFPRDIFKANFRIAPPNLSPEVAVEYQKIEGKLTITRYLHSVLVDATSGKADLKHMIVIANKSDYPVYELEYKETSPLIPSKGTVYINGGAYSDPEIKDKTYTILYPILEPGQTLKIEYISGIPKEEASVEGNLTFRMDPGKEQKIALPVNVPITLTGDMQKYTLAVYFGFGEYNLTEQTKKSLDIVIDFLRKNGFETLYVQLKGHTDSVRVKKERTDYTNNPDLSIKRSTTVEEYLKNHLIDMSKVQAVTPQTSPEPSPQPSPVSSPQQPSFQKGEGGVSPQGVSSPQVPSEVSSFFKQAEQADSAKISPLKTEGVTIQADDKTMNIQKEGFGANKPAVPNNPGLKGTSPNRRVEVKMISFKTQNKPVEIEFGTSLSRGLYQLRLSFDNTYPLEEMYDAAAFIELPPDFNYMNGSASLNDKPVDIEKKGNFFTISSPKIKAGEKFNLTMNLLAVKDTPIKAENFPCMILAKTKNGRTETMTSTGVEDKSIKAALQYYLKTEVTPQVIAQSTVDALKAMVRFGITFPEEDILQTTKAGNVKITLPLNTPYELFLNGEEISKDRIGESAKDERLGFNTYEYIGLDFNSVQNKLKLKWGNQTDERTITITGEISEIGYSIYPPKPPADGKTPIYVTLQLKDRNGNLIKENAFLDVTTDKGDLFDNEKKQFISYINNKFQVKVIAGTALVKLSPASTTEERRLTAYFGTLEKNIDIKFYPELRPWIVVGSVEGGMGLGREKNNPPETGNMPFDLHEGKTNYDGRAAVFGKGSIKDYTMTFRYDTRKQNDQNTLLKQNTPSTEENQLYPIYGDEAEQFFETQSKEKLFLKVEKDLSYFLYGDYQTDLGKDFQFNRYSRTLNGGVLNFEQSKNFRVKSFISKNDQSMIREEFEGKGISGPYFLKNLSLVEYSDTIYLQVRDRYNSKIILQEKLLNRFTDYSINYDEGWVIFASPVPHFDDKLNPVWIRMVYETRNLAQEQYMYGVRGEKSFFGGALTFGVMGVTEEHPEKNGKLYGADVLYDDGKRLRIAGEYTETENYQQNTYDSTSGVATHVDATYKLGADTSVKGFYTKVNNGFQNLSATNAETGYETYGVSTQTSFNENKTKITAEAGVENNSSVDRNKAEVHVDQEISKNIRASVGARWNKENAQTYQDDTIQGTAGISINPTEKLGITLQRDQSLTGATNSTTYPTKTSGRINYKVLTNLDAYVQTELQELADKEQSITSIGMDSRIGENTTAFTKYSMDDSVSGWRNQSHIGLNHQFIINKDFSLDAGLENIHTLSGDENKDDYTSPHLGFTYTQKDRYKLSGRAEARFGKLKDDYLGTLAGSVKIGSDYTMLASGRYFDSDYEETDIMMGLAYRPVANDKWNYLTKLRWKKRNQADANETKYIGSVHANYQPSQKVDFMGEYALKYTYIGDPGHTFTDLARVRVLYDITDRIDAGFHVGLLTQHDTHTYTLAYGPEIGFKVVENFWLTVGYNFSGFYDRDFDEANYWEQGPYFKIRLKFDENTIKNMYNKIRN